MSYIIAIKGPFSVVRHPNRILYPTKDEARREARKLNFRGGATEYLVYDADHEPGRSIARGIPLEI